jgi:hypothetical protein
MQNQDEIITYPPLDMKNSSIILLALLLCSCVAYSKNISLVYSEMRFNIPQGYNIIGSADLAGGMLTFRYGNKKGKGYIAFTDITHESTSDYGCPTGEFYIELFAPSEITKCNKKLLDELSETLLKNRVKRVWETPNVVINYLESKNSSEKIVFVCKKDGRTVQVDSDFLTEAGFRKMFTEILGK